MRVTIKNLWNPLDTETWTAVFYHNRQLIQNALQDRQTSSVKAWSYVEVFFMKLGTTQISNMQTLTFWQVYKVNKNAVANAERNTHFDGAKRIVKKQISTWKKEVVSSICLFVCCFNLQFICFTLSQGALCILTKPDEIQGKVFRFGKGPNVQRFLNL